MENVLPQTGLMEFSPPQGAALALTAEHSLETQLHPTPKGRVSGFMAQGPESLTDARPPTQNLTSLFPLKQWPPRPSQILKGYNRRAS